MKTSPEGQKMGRADTLNSETDTCDSSRPRRARRNDTFKSETDTRNSFPSGPLYAVDFGLKTGLAVKSLGRPAFIVRKSPGEFFEEDVPPGSIVIMEGGAPNSYDGFDHNRAIAAARAKNIEIRLFDTHAVKNWRKDRGLPYRQKKGASIEQTTKWNLEDAEILFEIASTTNRRWHHPRLRDTRITDLRSLLRVARYNNYRRLREELQGVLPQRQDVADADVLEALYPKTGQRPYPIAYVLVSVVRFLRSQGQTVRALDAACHSKGRLRSDLQRHALRRVVRNAGGDIDNIKDRRLAQRKIQKSWRWVWHRTDTFDSVSTDTTDSSGSAHRQLSAV